MNNLVERFYRYIAIDTQSARGTGTFPSTEKQKNLGKLLVKELKEMGVEDAEMDRYGTVYATIPASEGVDPTVPVIGFTAHMDTALELPGCNIKPRLIENYDGKDIILNAEKNIIFSVDSYPHIKEYTGRDIIVCDGTTLLGADDKAGIAEIMEVAHTLMTDSSIRHGKVKICFTCDEEIGQSTEHLNLDKFNPDFAYSMDGGEDGEFYYDNFNCGTCDVSICGKVAHTGYAKGQMVNASHLAMEFHGMLDPLEVPANTEGRQGFIHLFSITGEAGSANMLYMIRDHELDLYHDKQQKLRRIADFMNDKYGIGTVDVSFKDTMYNMRDKIMENPFVVENAINAMRELGIEPRIIPVRGGVDGAEITFKGLACPNLFTGSDRCHTRTEYACVQSMEKSYQLQLKLITNCVDKTQSL